MNTFLIVACIGMITGFFIIFGLSPIEFANGIFRGITEKPQSLKDKILIATNQKKKGYLKKEISEVQEILRLTQRSNRFGLICAISLLLFAVGASVAIMMGNIFLMPVLAIGFMFMPFWYVRLTQSNYKKDISAELETALSVITTAYLRTEDILTAIDENINYLNPPVKTVFNELLVKVKFINPDIEMALSEMKSKIENDVFKEWIDAIIACQSDRSLKHTLTPIVSKLSDMRIVNGELENLVFEPRKEFITMVILVLGNIPLMYMLNAQWYETLMHTYVGQFILAVCGAAIFISTAFVIRLTQPIEYKR